MYNLLKVSSILLSRRSSLSIRQVACRLASTDSSSSQPQSKVALPVKLQGIVDSIKGLTLLETADLVKALKLQLNIQEMAIPQVTASAVPGQGASTQANAAAAAKTEETAKVVEKTEFKIKLEKIDASQKAKMIREIKNAISGMNLVEAKKFVESVPKIVKESAPKEEAEKIKKALEAVGGTVVLE